MAVVFVSIPLMVSAVSADGGYEPPYFGPPNMHENTEPGYVDANIADNNAYPVKESESVFYLQSPWAACRQAGKDYINASISGGKYTQFASFGRTFTINRQDGDNNYIGGDYLGYGATRGHLELTKSDPSKETYDQVHLWGQKSSGQLVDVYLSLVQKPGFIGVANIASLGVITPCQGANENTQIWIPLGKGANGQPTVVFDVDGNGVPDQEFLEGPPLSGGPPAGRAVSVPTLSQWGLIVLTLVLLTAGLYLVRKRSSVETF